MKVVLCGFNWTGCEALKQLVELGHDVYVYTHESPYHVPSLVGYCEELGVPYSTDDISKSSLPFQPECIASIYYRYIIRPNVIEACKGKIFNLHPSLLPKYRGCSSLTWAMIRGEKKVGFTFHYIDEGCDTGDIVCQRELEIRQFDTQATLYQRVAHEAMKEFRPALSHVAAGLPGTPQQGEPSYFKRGCPYDGKIDVDWDEAMTKRFIRAMVFPPYAAASFQGEEVFTWSDLKAMQKNAA